MSAFVRLGGEHTKPVRVDLGMFEQLTNGQPPWTGRDETTGKIKRFGLCPECANPMQLINIDNPEPSQIPHGRHRLKPVPGFAYCLERILGCDRFNPSKKSQLLTETVKLTPEAIVRREFLATYFNLAVGILQEDIGIAISKNLADKILETYFEDRWYRWTYASLGNLPWLFPRTTKAHSLYGQQLRPNSDTCKAIMNNVPEACLGQYNRLQAKPGKRIYLEFGLRNHTVKAIGQSGGRETIVFYVVRPSLNIDTPADVVFEKTITLRPQEFLARVQSAQEAQG